MEQEEYSTRTFESWYINTKSDWLTWKSWAGRQQRVLKYKRIIDKLNRRKRYAK